MQLSASEEETHLQMTVAAQLNQLPKKASDSLKRMIALNKAYYEHLSKFGKSVSRDLPSTSAYESPMFPEWVLDKPLMNKVVAEHMYRTGCFGAGGVFTEEGRVDGISEEFKRRFRELRDIVEEMQDKRVDKALAWVREREHGGELEFQLHKCVFVEMLN